MKIPNWQKNSGKMKKPKGISKNRLKSRRQVLKNLLKKLENNKYNENKTFQ
jgi:hypothetical protein